MPYVYVLISLRNGKRYIGYTTKTSEERLRQHNSGTTQWTRQNGPFALLHEELFSDSIEARKRENFLKSGQGRKWLDENIG